MDEARFREQALAHKTVDGLADDDSAVLGGVVEIDVQVALGLQLDVDQAVARQLLQHVVEKTDAGGHGVVPGAVEIDGRGDLGLLGLALDARRTHGRFLGRGSLVGARCNRKVRFSLGLWPFIDPGALENYMPENQDLKPT